MNIIVLAGGTSNEREVSLRSGKAVSDALMVAGHTVTQLDTNRGFNVLLPQLKIADVVFPALHGFGGEDGSLQRFMEANNIAFVGSDSRASALCFDKFLYGELLIRENILMPQTELVNFEAFTKSELAKKPFVLKPNDGGSSIDNFIIRDIADVDIDAIEAVCAKHEKMLLQELIDGTEITVAILGNQVLPVIEIIPPSNQEFDYENKYNGATQELCPPQNVSAALQQAASELALGIHKLTGCKDLSRTDILIRDDILYVLETNTIPGMTTGSLLPKAAKTVGLGMPTLCSQLVLSVETGAA